MLVSGEQRDVRRRVKEEEKKSKREQRGKEKEKREREKAFKKEVMAVKKERTEKVVKLEKYLMDEDDGKREEWVVECERPKKRGDLFKVTKYRKVNTYFDADDMPGF